MYVHRCRWGRTEGPAEATEYFTSAAAVVKIQVQNQRLLLTMTLLDFLRVGRSVKQKNSKRTLSIHIMGVIAVMLLNEQQFVAGPSVSVWCSMVENAGRTGALLLDDAGLVVVNN